MKHYDAIIIGSGQAGPSLAAELVKAGQKVALAEGYRFGGSCVNYGCRPTKTLIASAHALNTARRGAEFGFEAGEVRADWPRVRARVLEIIETTSAGIERWLRGLDGLDVFHAFAGFEGGGPGGYRVRVGDELLEAPQVFLNTGTRALVPGVQGIESVPWLDSERLLRLETLPEHLIVLGGSYIGLEMGQAFRRLGSRVTVVETSQCLINREDQDIKDEMHRIFAREGVTVHTQSQLYKAEPLEGGGLRVHIRHDADGSEHALEGSHWLNAIGRVPNTDRLNLASIGLETDARGYLKVDGRLETGAPGVYALGDVNGRGAFTHTSYQDFEIVRDNLLRGGARGADGRTVPYALYTDPPLGRVGLSEREARASGRPILMAVRAMRRVGRALEESETDGLMKVLVDADSERIVGAAVLGFHGDEVIQAVSYFMATGASYKVMRDTLPVHPTVAEFWPTLLSELTPLE